MSSPSEEIDYHLSLLFAHELIECDGTAEEGDLLYTVDLESQPDWVRGAVSEHRKTDST
jgi:hypothetical protein